MAGIFFYVKPLAPITITTVTTNLTLLQVIAPTNHRVLIWQSEFPFNGITAADPPVLLEWLIQSTAGTMTALTPIPYDATYDETVLTTAQHTATAEPTAGNIKWSEYVHTQTGLILPHTKPIVVPGGTRLGVRYTSGTVTGTVKCAPVLLCEE